MKFANLANLSNFSSKNRDRNVVIPDLSFSFIIVVQSQIFYGWRWKVPKWPRFQVNVAVKAWEDPATLQLGITLFLQKESAFSLETRNEAQKYLFKGIFRYRKSMARLNKKKYCHLKNALAFVLLKQDRTVAKLVYVRSTGVGINQLATNSYL